MHACWPTGQRAPSRERSGECAAYCDGCMPYSTRMCSEHAHGHRMHTYLGFHCRGRATQGTIHAVYGRGSRARQSANALTGCGVLCEQRRAWRRSRRGMLSLVASGHCIRHPARHRRRVSSGLVYSNSVVHATTHFAIASYRDTVGWYRYSKRWTEKR